MKSTIHEFQKTKINTMIKKSILLLATIFSFISCSKDDDPMPATKSYFEENFLNGYLNINQI